MYLSREQMLTPPALPHEDVPVSEFGEGAVARVRSLSAAERGAWEKATYASGTAVDLSTYKLRLSLFCMVDEADKRIFADTPEDMAVLGAWPAAGVEKVFQAAAALNGMLAANVDAIEKNSAATPGSETSGS